MNEYQKCLNPNERREIVEELTQQNLRVLPWHFEFWAHQHQIPHNESYSNWVLLGGRGAGKTRAGAEWVRLNVEGLKPQSPGVFQRFALIGDTYHEARDVMVFGESGILTNSPPDRKPKWIASRNCLEWPNGATAQIFSAQKPESLRGSQFHGAWLDEFAKWKNAQDVWDILQFAMRLGSSPKILITTTPKPLPLLEQIISMENTHFSHAGTFVNQDNLPDAFLENITAQYDGTTMGRQEIDGEIVHDLLGALWARETIPLWPFDEEFGGERLVIAVDPNVSSKAGNDACGIIVASAKYEGESPKSWKALVHQDASLTQAKPEEWAKHVIALYHELGADQVIAEVNQGGELVETMLRNIDPFVNYKSVTAKSSKWVRAEPVAALYRQGRVFHAARMPELEAEMLQMTTTGYQGNKSPDRLDALVWALDALILNASMSHRTPGLSRL